MTVIYTCYSEWCRTHHACDCGSKCCNGYYTPMQLKVVSDHELQFSDDEGITWELDEVETNNLINLVIRNECPHCQNSVEC